MLLLARYRITLIVWTRIQENTLCTCCNISYFPDHQNVKRPNKFETPGPETDIHGNVLTQDKPLITAICPETWTKKKEDKLPEVFEALKGKGLVDQLRGKSWMTRRIVAWTSDDTEENHSPSH